MREILKQPKISETKPFMVRFPHQDQRDMFERLAIYKGYSMSLLSAEILIAEMKSYDFDLIPPLPNRSPSKRQAKSI